MPYATDRVPVLDMTVVVDALKASPSGSGASVVCCPRQAPTSVVGQYEYD